MTILSSYQPVHVLATECLLPAFSLNIEQQYHDTSTLRTFYRFNVFDAVPLDREITYAEVAKKVSLDEDRITRVMQYAMTNGFFNETKRGCVVHSASSAAVVRDEKLRAMVGRNCEKVYPAV